MYLVSGRQLRFYINHVIGYNRLILILILAGVHIKHMLAIFSSVNASAYKLTGILYVFSQLCIVTDLLTQY